MNAQPLSLQDRVEAMDVLRGFALYGVFSVNMLFFSAPFYTTMMRPWPEAAHPVWQAALLFLLQGKFYGLFSFLFGMGFAEQSQRLEARGEPATRIFRRRLAWLLVFGLAHGLLIWMGDILFMYALLGFVLLAFRKRRPRTLLIWVFALLGSLMLLFLAGFGFLSWAQGQPEVAASLAKASAKQAADIAKATQESLRIYGSGDYGALFRLRARELVTNYAMTLSVVPQILAMFLLGAWVSRRRILREPGSHGYLLRRTAWVGLAVGFAGNAFVLWATREGMPGPTRSVPLLGMAVSMVANPALTLGYAACLVLALDRGRFPWLRKLAWSGRMALTNYLMHSLVFTTVFCGFGLGLFGKVGLPWCLAMAAGLWLLQIPLSKAWLSRHKMGPAEHLWRRLTYGRGQA